MKNLNVSFENTHYLASDNFIGQAESKDCVVRALAGAFDIDYLIAWNVLALFGRQHKKGTERSVTYKAVDKLCSAYGYEATHIDVPILLRATNIAHTNRNNTGAIILMFTKRHLTLFKNGKLQDTFIDTNYVTHYITLTKTNQEQDMATSVKNLTTEERSKLIEELSDKISRNSFTKDDERDKAMKLMKMLSRHKAVNYSGEVAEVKPILKLNLSFGK